MNAINATAALLVQAVLSPLAGWPILGLAVFGIVSGILASIVFRYTSPQKTLRRVADKTRAHLLAMKLFKDEFGVTVRSLGALLVLVVVRILLTLPPMIVLALPFTLLLAHLATWYEYRAPRPGETFVLEATIRADKWSEMQGISIGDTRMIEVDAGPIPNSLRHSFAWRLKALAAGPNGGLVVIPGGLYEKRIAVESDVRRLSFASPCKPNGVWDSWEDVLLYPAERPFPADSPVQRMAVHLEPRRTPVFGWNVPWWLTFFLFTLVGAFAAKPFVKVQF